MSILSGRQLAKYYGAQDVFANVSFDIARGDKIGFVGPNGTGKTTLLRIILRLEEPTDGTVSRARNLRVGYLPQNSEFPSQQTVYREMLNVFDALREQQRALAALASEMSRTPDSAELVQQYAKAEQQFELAGGYEYENRIHRVLSGLGFASSMYSWPIAVLSGGQVTRALLAKLLLQEPELLVLDEPTNYLDLDALEWLESYLQEWKQSLLVVSHDRYFLDKVVSRIWEMDHGSLETYRGNYSHYVQQRADRRLRQLREYQEQQELIAKTEDFIRRYGAGQRSKEAQGRETRLRRMELVDRPQEDKRMHLRLATTLRSGDNVLMSEGATIGYLSKPDHLAAGEPSDEQHCLFDTGEFLIQRGQRVALLGPNGCGKTTFIRTVLGDTSPLQGRIRLGASVRIGYLPQNQGWLDENKTALDHILEAGNLQVEEARNLLGRFLFSGDDVFKVVSMLSGGERARLGLAILTLRGANLLILDEPTTHLDVASQEILQDVLDDFNGTILFVTHDRYLIDALATHVWVIGEGQMRQFEGNYSAYMQTLAEEKAAAAGTPKESAGRPSEDERRMERRKEREARQRVQYAEQLEANITDLERELDRLTELIDRASAQQDTAQVQSLGAEYQQVQQQLSERLQEWEQVMSTLSGEAL
ncbi:MAG: ABC-F family ATP-binding cassette domain-containing protein [Chloroflexi bacterium]|jgi:ATP-binding cassette subfamily F protein 3|nr:ABC-F family ATP-binding cassette domain-containing protein [Chloroflexota bacterium]